ncbi:MAG: hypothetical protein IJ746_08400, partial [Ruminococcus sp.]|nr:hypothetical protein [Ruminococcus sp.]
YDDDDDDEDEDEKDEEPVKLDDFLFGGENDKEKRSEQARAGEEETAPARQPVKAEPDPEQYAPKQQPKEPKEPVEAAPVRQPEPEPEAQKPAVDPSYYEKASKLIDGDAPEAPASEEPAEEMKLQTPKKKVVKKRPAELKFSGEKKNASAGMADLMKLMEQEQNKLKEQLGKKDE